MHPRCQCDHGSAALIFNVPLLGRLREETPMCNLVQFNRTEEQLFPFRDCGTSWELWLIIWPSDGCVALFVTPQFSLVIANVFIKQAMRLSSFRSLLANQQTIGLMRLRLVLYVHQSPR
jgi:hypothetical protein